MAKAIVDLDTGEIIRRIDDDYKITSPKSIDYLKARDKRKKDWIDNQEEKYDFIVWDIKSWVKGNVMELREIHKELNLQERGFLASLSVYMNYSHCGICFDNGKHLSVENMAEVCGISIPQTYKYLNSLMQKNLLGVWITKSKKYYLNPFLYVKGDKIDATLKNMFGDYIIRSEKNGKIISKWDKYGIKEA